MIPYQKSFLTRPDSFHRMRYRMDGFEAGSDELIFRGPVQSAVEEYRIFYSDELKSEQECGWWYTWTPAQTGTVCVDV